MEPSPGSPDDNLFGRNQDLEDISELIGDLSTGDTILDAQLAQSARLDNFNIATDFDATAASLVPLGIKESPLTSPGSASTSGKDAWVEVVEQPQTPVRFRYKCEGRSAGSLQGISSTNERKTFPSIRVWNYSGYLAVVVSCVCKDPLKGDIYPPHPHNLVGRECKDSGVCTVKLSVSSNQIIEFSNIGIQCVKKKEVQESLARRNNIGVLPFGAASAQQDQTAYDLKVLRLCFQVFRKCGDDWRTLATVVSDPIYDKSVVNDLVILEMSRCSCSVSGKKRMMLVCEKITKEDTKVRFFEGNPNRSGWEEYAEIEKVIKQCVVVLIVPPYKNAESENGIQVKLELQRPSDGKKSESRLFIYKPKKHDSDYLLGIEERKRKQPRTSGSFTYQSPSRSVISPKDESHFETIDDIVQASPVQFSGGGHTSCSPAGVDSPMFQQPSGQPQSPDSFHLLQQHQQPAQQQPLLPPPPLPAPSSVANLVFSQQMFSPVQSDAYVAGQQQHLPPPSSAAAAFSPSSHMQGVPATLSQQFAATSQQQMQHAGTSFM